MKTVKTKTILLLVLSLFFTSISNAQIVGGSASGQAPASEIAPSGVSEGGYSGDVNLFNGTYNSSYTLGSVSNPAGLSFTATMSYSSTLSGGDEMPHTSGVPYGEGWSVDYPTISVSVEDFNKYTVQKSYQIQTDPQHPTKQYNFADAHNEGDLYWFAPVVNVPGVGSGRMVFKYYDNSNYKSTFVLHKFDRYIEAIFDGSRWEVIVDDGTRYEFSPAVVAHRQASNQRVQASSYNNVSHKNLTLPKTEILTWVATQMYNRNIPGKISFVYQGYGAFDYNAVYKQARISETIDQAWTYTGNQGTPGPPLATVYKELVIKQITSGYEKLDFEYENIGNLGGVNMLNPEDEGVFETDPMFSYQVVESWGEDECGSESFGSWARYRHMRSDEIQSQTSPLINMPIPTNPYVGNYYNNSNIYYDRETIPSGTNEVLFDHSFLESERIGANFPAGDVYEIQATIHSPGMSDPQSTNNTGYCMFDINIASGDNSINQGWPAIPAEGTVKKENYDKKRGESLFSTFNQAFKWFNAAEGATNEEEHYNIMKTSNFFTLKNLPNQYDGFNIQIGPSGSDMDYRAGDAPEWLLNCALGSTEQQNPPIWNAYFPQIDELTNPALKSGDDIPHTFGIGMPWHLMHGFYTHMHPEIDYSQNSPDNFWWADNSQSSLYCWDNTPTRTDENQLIGVKLIRHAKNPYMLVGVKHSVFNVETTPSSPGNSGGLVLWHITAQLGFEYEIQNTGRYVNVLHPEDTDPTLEGKDLRNVVLLKSIVQLPKDGILGESSEGHPTTHFTYDFTQGLQNQNILGWFFGEDQTYPDFTNTEYYGTNFPKLIQVVSPLGKRTTITYDPLDGSGKSYTIPKFQYRERPVELMNSPSIEGYRQSKHYAFQTYLVVNNITIDERAGSSPKSYNYTFGDLQSIGGERPFMSANFVYDHSGSAKTGFNTTSVEGPTAGIKTDYQHYTDYMKFGKVASVSSFDANGVLLSENTSTYETVVAYEPPGHRKFDGNYFYDEYNDSNRPVLDSWTDIESYNQAIKDWRSGHFNTAWANWEQDEPIEPDLDCGSNNPADEAICNCDYYESLSLSNQNVCDTYSADYEAWMEEMPAEWHFFDLVSSPDQKTPSGIYDAAKFYETRYREQIMEKQPLYLYSFFVKKIQDESTVYDGSCNAKGGSGQNAITTTTLYEYFDADYSGRIPQSSSGYQELLHEQTIGYINFTGRLFSEPSWQLYSKTSYTDAMGGPDDAYTKEENFYLYDLVNEKEYFPGGNDFSLPSSFFMLWKLTNLDKARAIPFQTRITNKVSGEDPITKSSYYVYSNDWEQFTEQAVVEQIDNPFGETAWPCDDPVDNTGNGGTGGTGGNGYVDVIYNDCGGPCSFQGAPYGSCPHPTEINWLCQCCPEENPGGTDTGYQTNFDGDDLYYNDNEKGYIVNTIAGKIFLKSVLQQVQTCDQDILQFDMQNGTPIFCGDIAEGENAMLTANTILLRNAHGQVVEEQNERDIVTRYTFNPLHIWEYEDCQNGHEAVEQLYVYRHVGLPVEVTVGHGRTDALTTIYDYNMDKTIASVTDPNEMVLTYSYDEFGRMRTASRNGTVLKSASYSNWNNAGGTFKQRAEQNFVTTTDFVTPDAGWDTQSWVDPLGRSVASAKGGVPLENNIFDVYDRPILKLNPASGAPAVNFQGTPSEHAELRYDIAPRSRPIQSSKYGESIDGLHTVTYSYCIAGSGYMAGEIGAAGQTVIPPGTYFSRTSTTDEDGKTVIEYTNAIGQKVATITNNGTAATVFLYNSHGSIKEVHNPALQLSEYTYNYLGQLYEKLTVDGGVTRYGYDVSGNLVSEEHANGQNRIYDFDDYGRMTGQYKSDSPYSQNTGAAWIFDRNNNYQTWNALVQAAIPEKKWFYENYSTSVAGIANDALPYLQNSLSNTKGRVVQTVSYEHDEATPIEMRFFSYNDDGFLKWEMNQFNYNGIGASGEGLLVRMDYPEYNLQGGYLKQNIDLDGDQTLDFQYSYIYDSWNRIKEVYANYDNAGTNGHKIAEYVYDNIKGVVKEKRYYASAEEEQGPLSTGDPHQCPNEQIDEFIYEYDIRHRLTSKTSTLFDWDLFYDNDNSGNNPDGFAKNFNGNINASLGTYKFTGGNVPVQPQDFGATTAYNYLYDNLNRLTHANALTQGSSQNQDFLGDTDYSYDKIGNITALNRWESYGQGQVDQSSYGYTYETDNNKLINVTGNTPTQSSSWDYTYDGSGNLLTDEKRDINATTYGRAHLPWIVAQSYYVQGIPSYTTSEYKYDVNDARIFKSAKKKLGPDVLEYYLRDASGREIAIYDFNNDDLTWYIYGNERVAKIGHQPDYNLPEILPPNPPGGPGGPTELPLPPEPYDTICPPGGLSGRDRTPCKYYRTKINGQYGQAGQIAMSNTSNQQLLQVLHNTLVVNQQTGEETFNFPDTLNLVRLPDQSSTYRLQADIGTLPSGSVTESSLPLLSPTQRLTFIDENGADLLLSIQEALDFIPYDRPPRTPPPPPSDPFDIPLEEMEDPPVPAASYYVYDHLGNTRVLYSPDIICQSVAGNTQVSVTYILNHVVDYFPYGKVLREYKPGLAERFLTTYHQRDQETGLDYRGARFYDSDIGRFLSLDPLAADYAAWSAYNYVLGNPISFIDPDGRAPEPPKVRIYTQSGAIGHTFLTVGIGANTTVYTYGRYANLAVPSSGGLSPAGEGVLIRLTGDKAKGYVTDAISKYESTAFDVSDADGDKVAAYLDGKFESSEEMPSVGKYKDDPDARVIDTYTLDDNNCTTLSCDAVGAGGSSMITDVPIANPDSPTGTMDVPIFKPSSLETILKHQASQENSVIKETTSTVLDEFND